MSRRRKHRKERKKRAVVRAKCLGCGKLGPIHNERRTGEFISTCPNCGSETAIYDPQLNDPPAATVPHGRVLTE